MTVFILIIISSIRKIFLFIKSPNYPPFKAFYILLPNFNSLERSETLMDKGFQKAQTESYLAQVESYL